MVEIIEIQVFFRLKDGGLDVITAPPTSQDTAAIKLDTSRIVKRVVDQGNAEYWYMVVKVRKSDGSFGYRTMIPKTLIV